jgi:integrase/recombinase XerD
MFIQENDVHFLTKKEQGLLLSKVDNIKHKLIIFLMLDAGLRVSEACSLKLENFNFKNKSMTVRSLKRHESSKKLFRTIPLSDRLYLILADYLYNNKHLHKEDYLFPSGDTHLSRDAANKFLSRINYKLNIKNLHPHALRHTFATNHIATGTPLENVKEMLGHERYDTTLIYTHIPVELLRSNIEAVAGANLPLIYKLFRFFNNKEPKIINIPTQSNGLSIGRGSLIEKVENFVNRDINVLIQADIGVGKSHILEHLNLNKKVLKLDDTENIRVSLVFLLLYLYKNDKEAVKELLYSDLPLDQIKVKLNRLSVRSLCDEIKKVVEVKEYVLLIDSVDRITPKGVKTLEELKDTFTIVTSAREVPLNKNSFLWNFEIIKVKPLERRFALDLINRLSYDLDIEDYELFRNHVYEQTNGNPRAIYEIIERYRKEPVITSEVVRDIRHYGSMREIDMSLLVIIFLASLAVLRYVSREVDNDSFRFIGGASLIALIIFRYLYGFTKRKFV